MIWKALFLLWSVAAVSSPSAAAERSPEVNYILRCSGCHGLSGVGNPDGGIPAFPGMVGAFSHVPEGRRYLANVPGVIGASLSAKEIADVLNYVMDNWAGVSLSPTHTPFEAGEIQDYMAAPVADPVALRRKIGRDLSGQGIPLAEYPWP